MKVCYIVLVLINFAVLTRSKRAFNDLVVSKNTQNPVALKRSLPGQALIPPNKTCNSSTEGNYFYNLGSSKSVWICKNFQWILYQLSLSAGQSCKHIRDASLKECLPSQQYWIQEMEIYCEMDKQLDGGGWTLVWQHSYMEDVPLTTNMTFFSNYYKPCIQHATSWCNIPNKASFDPSEQMIVAYLNKQVIYAYKGAFNRNIDYDWTGGYLLVYTQIIDNCSYNRGTQPSPVKSIPGIAFSKISSSCSYQGTGGTIKGSLTSPSSDRWAYCRGRYGPTNEQMTLAIYVR